jgi:predicted anti-sigma-YlaC factor YlaD
MKCRDFKDLLSAYADGELSRTQREFVEEHLYSCINCRTILEKYRSVNQKLTSLREVPIMSDIKGTIIQKIKEEPVRKPLINWLRPALGITAVITLITVLLTGILEMSGTTGGVMSPPPLTWEKLNLILSLFLLVAFLIMLGRLGINKIFDWIIAGIGPILFGIIGIIAGIHELQIGHPEVLIIMGTISVFGLIMGIIFLIRRSVNRWVAITGILLCLSVLVLEAIMFIGYPIPQIWLTIVTVVIPVGIISYAFQRERKQSSRISLRLDLVMTSLMVIVTFLLAAQLWGREINWITGGVMPPATSLPPLSYTILNDTFWLAILMGTLMVFGLAFKNRIAHKVADIGSTLFGIIGWYIGLYALTTLKSDLFLAMGIIPIFGLTMGIIADRKGADRRWLTLLGVVLCISALVLDTIFLVTYPVIHVWVIIATILIPVAVIVYTVMKK